MTSISIHCRIKFLVILKVIELHKKYRYGYIQLITYYQNFPEDTKDIAQSIVHKFQDILKVWDIPNSNEYYFYPFQFPPSTFKKKIDIFGKYPKMNQIEAEYNEVSDLSKEQISSIFQKGTFEIPSKMFPIPYVWKLSTWVIKGREPINQSFCFDLGYAYNSIRTISQRIYKKESKEEFNLTLTKGMKNLVIKPLVYISILVGFRQIVEEQNVDRIYNEIEADRQLKLSQMPNINKAIYMYLRKTELNKIEVHEKYRILTQFAKEFDVVIDGIKFQMRNLYDLIEQQNNRLLNVEDEEEKEYKDNIQALLAETKENYIEKYGIQVQSDQDIEEQIQNAIYQAQRIYWESNTQFGKEIIRNIVDIAECLRIYDYYYQIMNDELNKQVQLFEDKLIDDHPIRIHCDLYTQTEIANFRSRLRQDLVIETDKKILFELKDLGEVQIYQEYIQNWQGNKRLAENRIASNLYLTKHPNIEITCTRKCFPPYKVLYENQRYSLEREKTYKVNSKCFGWKLQLLLVRWFTWSVTVMYWLFANAISGPMGIRALCSINEFHPDVQIDMQTGRISPTGYTVSPVIVVLQTVYQGMRDSRNSFENAPDTGFFGKNCARICNLLEVYIFRFLIVGVVFVIILMPITIICNFVISLILAITAFAWIPICLLSRYVFSITIYDFDVEDGEKQTLFYTPPWFPLIVNTFQLLWNGIFQVFICLLLIFVLQPALALFTFIFALLRYSLRSLYDCFMILFVKCFGRVPAFENNLAWKISGPGQSIKHFYAVSMEQLILLVAAELERIVYEKYKTNICSLIQASPQQISEVINPFFKQFNANYSFNDPGCQKLITSLDVQISQRLQLLPKINVKIKFTELELLHALKITKQFVKTQIILKDLSEYIWLRFAIRKGDYNSLVETLFTTLFGSQILEPFEDVDTRFQLDQNESQKLMHQVQKALKGKINLEMPENYTIKKKQLKKKAINKEFIQFSDVLGYVWESQSTIQRWNSLNFEKRRFLLNCSLVNYQ